MTVVYKSNQFILSVEEEQVYIQVIEKGVTVYQFNDVLKQLPQVKVTSFSELQGALKSADNAHVIIGTLKPRVELEVSKDEMTAYVKLNISLSEIETSKELVVSEILELLEANGICAGIQTDCFQGALLNSQKIEIAKGIPPVAGEDSKYAYYKVTPKQPKTNENETTDYYELNIIDNVSKGDWLGEKTLPQSGIDGVTVKGNKIPARFGRDYTLKYDPKTVEERFEKDKFVLRAKQNGAVNFEGEKIKVEDHLIISGDVDYETGNIRFDGSVTISGTVQDKFVVEATGDINIKGATGVGAVGRIVSSNGSVFIQGGVNGKNEGRIIAKDSIFVKFVNEGYLEAGNEIHVALYAFDSFLKADKVFLDPKKGKVVGGKINAKHKIVSGSIGNIQERQTIVNVEGFERIDIKAELDAMKLKFKDLLSSANRMKRKLEIFETNMDRLDDRAKNTYGALVQNYQTLLDDLGFLSRKAEKLEDILRTRGEGEIKIHKSIYPKTMMELKTLQRSIVETMNCSFYVKDNRIHVAD
ncbi:DUF342 domain-containing protein [Fusibacter ferrireducens]|uniref:DUF342 domain-containing protein n=1 Tax=Fusibacter ferrireducens TaxID=2785058 RepID=A0ABR9ZMQ7_9FIRM|nr:FapA family protein [Fusibacter ferrireducens]MBF4691689.1 DUF342 domain-containing protein [Fusibacter ferrireducens]